MSKEPTKAEVAIAKAIAKTGNDYRKAQEAKTKPASSNKGYTAGASGGTVTENKK